MTVKEWWQHIAEYTRAGDWNGILVAADGLQELDEEEVAVGLRKIVCEGPLPTYDQMNSLWVFKVDVDHPTICQYWCHYCDTDYGIIYGWQWNIDADKYKHQWVSNQGACSR